MTTLSYGNHTLCLGWGAFSRQGVRYNSDPGKQVLENKERAHMGGNKDTGPIDQVGIIYGTQREREGMALLFCLPNPIHSTRFCMNRMRSGCDATTWRDCGYICVCIVNTFSLSMLLTNREIHPSTHSETLLVYSHH